MKLATYKMRCVACETVFHEIGNEEVEECPVCGVSLFEESTTEELSMEYQELMIDRKTGELTIRESEEEDGNEL